MMSAFPTDPEAAGVWQRKERERLGWSTIRLADEARRIAQREGSGTKLTQQSVSGFEQPGKKRLPEWLRFVSMAFEEAENGPQPDRPVVRSADGGETVEIVRLDLSLPMGPGATVDDYVEEEPVVFDLGFVRTFTRTPPHRLRLARGVGDSMFPTLLNSDLVWIDSTQTDLNQADKVWAVSINGAAAIKRLRRLKAGRVLVISDNPALENYEVEADEIRIGGRVIRFARDL